MAYRELGVIELREVWRRYSAGDGVRAIARGTGVDWKTIAKYVAAAVAVGLSRGAPPPTDEQLAAFVRRLRGTPGGRPAALPERLAPYQPQIAAWLADGLRLTKIHRRLRAQGLGVPYSSLHRFAQAQCGFGAPSVTVRVAEPPPGEAAEADFGRLGRWSDPVTGSHEYVYGLLVTLAFGVRVVYYLEDRERTLDSPTEKLLLSVATFADEMERVKARARTRDAMTRKARAGYVTGGRKFGYANVEVPGPDGRRAYVERRINPTEAAVVVRIFELTVAGHGRRRIAHQLNAEGAPAPRAQQGRKQGWSASTVGDVLKSGLYRGEIIWGRTVKRDT